MIRLHFILAPALVAVMLPSVVHAWPWHSKSHATIEGAWKLVGAMSGPGGALVPTAPGFVEYKLVHEGYFMWTSLQDGKIVRHAGGVAHIGPGTYTERLDYCDSDALASYVGTTHEFTWKLDGDRWYHTGVLHGQAGDFRVGEVWERAR